MKMDGILDQVDGAVGIADDVAVYARSDAEHDQVLHNLMKVAAKKWSGIQLREMHHQNGLHHILWNDIYGRRCQA